MGKVTKIPRVMAKVEALVAPVRRMRVNRINGERTAVELLGSLSPGDPPRGNFQMNAQGWAAETPCRSFGLQLQQKQRNFNTECKNLQM